MLDFAVEANVSNRPEGRLSARSAAHKGRTTVGWFRRKKHENTPLTKLNLQHESLRDEGVTDGIRIWRTPDGDAIGLYHFGLPPDLPSGQPSIEAFCVEYRSLMQGEVVETGIEKVADLPVVQIIGKVPQAPTGMTYVGSYTIPFRDFSYVVKVQCEERGTTGIREAILFEKGRASGELELDDSGTLTGDWDPDNAVYDADFPDHPLSRCRRGLQMIASSMSLSDEIRLLPKFALPRQ